MKLRFWRLLNCCTPISDHTPDVIPTDCKKIAGYTVLPLFSMVFLFNPTGTKIAPTISGSSSRFQVHDLESSPLTLNGQPLDLLTSPPDIQDECR